MDKAIRDYLKDMGAPPHIKGYQYLISAIKRAINDISTLDAITKGLYPDIAEELDTTPARVERAIRHCIEIMWTHGNTKMIHEVFGYSISTFKDKPTNSHFIAASAEYLRDKTPEPKATEQPLPKAPELAQVQIPLPPSKDAKAMLAWIQAALNARAAQQEGAAVG